MECCTRRTTLTMGPVVLWAAAAAAKAKTAMEAIMLSGGVVFGLLIELMGFFEKQMCARRVDADWRKLLDLKCVNAEERCAQKGGA